MAASSAAAAAAAAPQASSRPQASPHPLCATLTGAEKHSASEDFLPATFIVYSISLKRGTRTWNIQRRFSNFLALQLELERKYGKDIAWLSLPPKRTLQGAFSHTDASSPFVQARISELNKYIESILAHANAAHFPEVLRFFEDWRELRALKSEDQIPEDVPQEIQYKILFTGDYGTGKTSLIKRYAQQKFGQNYVPTLGVDFALKELNWDNGGIVRLQLWDIAGQERYSGFTQIYYKEAAGAFVVFDLNKPATFHSVAKWKRDIDANAKSEDGTPIPVVLLANKFDCYDVHNPKNGPDGDGVALSSIDDFCKEHGFLGWYRTSAKEDLNVSDAVSFLVRSVMKKSFGPAAGLVPPEAGMTPATPGSKSAENGEGCVIL